MSATSKPADIDDDGDGSTDPSLPCIIDGSVAIQLERLASVKEGPSDYGVNEDIVICGRASQLNDEPIAEEFAGAAALIVPQRKGSIGEQMEVSSQESCSPLHSPRDASNDENLSPFYSFLHSKVCV